MEGGAPPKRVAPRGLRATARTLATPASFPPTFQNGDRQERRRMREKIKLLSDLIPEKTLSVYLDMYTLIKGFPFKNYKEARSIDTDIANDILNNLKKLHDRAGIDGKTFHSIIDKLTAGMNKNNKWSNKISPPIYLFSTKKERRPKDHALDILIYAIVYDLKLIGKPNYRIVADFLSEQNIGDNLEEEQIRLRFRRQGSSADVMRRVMHSGLMNNKNFLTNCKKIKRGFIAQAVNAISQPRKPSSKKRS
jgi:hypothetical protein